MAGAEGEDDGVPGRVPAVGRAAAILREVARQPGGLSLADLARALGAPKSSLLNVCMALSDERLLRRNESGRYEIGFRIAELAAAQLARPPRLQRVAFAVQTLGHSFFATEVQGLGEAARQIGAALCVVDAAKSLAQQVAQLKALSRQRLDAVVLDAVDSEGVAEGIAALKRSGIPVVAVNVGASGADATVTTDNTQAGELVGRHLAGVLNGRGKIAVIGGTAVTAVSDRITGFLSSVSAYPDISVVIKPRGDNTRNAGYDLAGAVLDEHPDVDGFFGINDPTSDGIAHALKLRQRRVPIVSVDGSADAVEIIRAGGTIIATAAQDPRGLATYALRLAERIHAGARPAERTRLLPTSLITSANAASYVPWG